MSEPVEIREARSDDAAGIARVHIRSWQETYRGLMPDDYLDALEALEGERRETHWKALLSTPEGRQTVCVATAGGQIVGFVSFGKARDTDLVADGEIYSIYLLKAYHKRGIGRALLERAMGLLRAMGIRSASLWVAKGSPTEGFYRRMGAILQAEKIERHGGAEALAVCRYVWTDLARLAPAAGTAP